MGLPTTYTQEFKKFKDFFNQIRDAQAPAKFTTLLLEDWGYKSKNHRAFIPLLKSLGFLNPEGAPTQRYLDYRNHSISKKIMGEAIKDAYSDIFLIKDRPTSNDKDLIEGKFKSYHNTSDGVASLMSKTFYALLELADLDSTPASPGKHQNTTTLNDVKDEDENETEKSRASNAKSNGNFGLHYNIQIHLPPTKDVEVYNAIFKSLKDHFLE